ncbi:nucleoside deaminase [Clostridium botulinum]|uniref:tRNA-specific adenosine deaminase n=1 Tax=Clostridium botulinum TaxID=1491 RepID=A0A9Q1ZBM7_CLOBO|nr:nucleoside deaminase [Clostridium botulinum]AEB77183.1 CMP/dCMP deaminase, zinc-binding protein [Clostridium botulinum BKT015925]KEI02036.1 adenosine deaminase [Clostridium botulinum C/D str. Sp77]KEI03154.1 adenosine deaminase [Clostridium botulinum D str. 16868]KLU75570.1 adenosine deaminase [Clostridium botulinum V891]KOA74532.1 adenosine deaminase [Clostridium botulinum]
MEEEFMKLALKEAEIAKNKEEVPVGAVIVKNGKVIASAHNLRETLKDPTAHAEILAIKKACGILGNWRLSECEMYVTLEPCPMCTGAIIQSRIKKIYIGTFDPVAGCCGSVVDLAQNRYLNTMVDVTWIYDKECSEILTNFFKNRRK